MMRPRLIIEMRSMGARKEHRPDFRRVSVARAGSSSLSSGSEPAFLASAVDMLAEPIKIWESRGRVETFFGWVVGSRRS